MKHVYPWLCAGLLALLPLANVWAQPVGSYAFSTTMRPYAGLTGGTVLGDTSNTAFSLFQQLPLGFTFSYGGQSFTTASVALPGYIKLGSALRGVSGAPLTDTQTDDTLISAYGQASIQPRGDAQLSYLTEGTAGARTFTVEWRNYKVDFNDSRINFQIKLYEQGGRIEFCYGAFNLDTLSTTQYLQIGLRGNINQLASDYHARFADPDSGQTWATTRRGIPFVEYVLLKSTVPEFKPSSGLVYTWLPPAACAGTPVAGVLSGDATQRCVGQRTALSLAGASPYAPGLAYTFQQSTDNGASWQRLASQAYTQYNAAFAGPVLYRAIVSCGTDSATTNTVSVAAVAANTFATAPLLATFDSTWQDRCGTANVPDATTWASSPGEGFLSWRGKTDAESFLPALAGRAAVVIGAGQPPSSTAGYTGDLDLYIALPGTTPYLASLYFINPFGPDSLQILLSTDGGTTFAERGLLLGGMADTNANRWSKRTLSLGVVNAATAVLRLRILSGRFFGTVGVDSLYVGPDTRTATGQGLAVQASTLYPNPGQGRVTLRLGQAATQARIQVCDALGRSVYEQAFTGSAAALDLSHLPKGCYTLSLRRPGHPADSHRYILR